MGTRLKHTAENNLNLFTRREVETKENAASKAEKSRKARSPFSIESLEQPTCHALCGGRHGKNWNEKDIENWYQRHLKKAKPDHPEEVQLIIELQDGTPIGESGCGKRRKGWSCRGYMPPIGKLVGMTDVKLAPDYWGKGYGTEAMREVVRYLFIKTPLDVILVPPHRENIAAIKVYQKSGFRKTKGIYWFDHFIMETTRENFLSQQKR